MKRGAVPHGVICLTAVILSKAGVAAAELSPSAPPSIRDSYHHVAWTAKEGAPLGVWTITQTTDGWLWMGCASGLYRFDGVSFERIDLLPADSLESRSVRSVTAAADGGLWVVLAIGRTARLPSSSRITPTWVTDIPSDERIDGIREDGAGTTWAFMASNHAYLISGTALRALPKEWSFPSGELQSVKVDPSGNMWVATATDFAVRRKASQGFERPATNWTPGATIGVSRAGQLWMADANGYRLLTDVDGTPLSSSPLASAHGDVGASVLTQEGSWWSVDCDFGVCRGWPAPANRFQPGDRFSGDAFTRADGLTSDRAMILFEDQEGDIWVGTKQGVDQFRRNEYVRVHFPQPLIYFAMAKDSESGIWSGTGQDYDTIPNHLWRIDPYPNQVPGSSGFIGSAFAEMDGSTLFGGIGTAWRLLRGRIEELPIPPPNGKTQIRTIARDGAGRLWASFMGGRTFRVDASGWNPKGGLAQLHDGMATAMTTEAGGGLWIGFPDNAVSLVQGDRVTNFTAADGLRLGPVTAMSLGKHALFGGEYGIALFRNGHFDPLSTDKPEGLKGISGIAQTRNGDLWLYGSAGAQRINAADFEQAVQNPSYRMPARLFDAEDGLPAGAQQAVGAPSILEDKQGRLWFASADGLAWLQSTEKQPIERPPTVQLLSLSTPEGAFPASTGLQLPIGTRNVSFRYTALSLRIPSRIKFRFRLSGVDQKWRSLGGAREANYSNLAPGSYRVEVLASNTQGAWGDVPASLDFSIRAAFYQTNAFRATGALCILLVLYSLFRLQTSRAAARVASRMNDRMQERERIARELHDTLLQDVQALSLNLRALHMKYGDAYPASADLVQLDEAAQRSLAEARARVIGLRAIRSENDLEATFKEFGEQLSALYPAILSLESSGTPAALRPETADEIVAIGREALLNAFRHAKAKAIALSISYKPRSLDLVVSDDGIGISVDETSSAEILGHFGVRGMRERANSIKAKLSINSRKNGGTRVSLSVPAAIAFAKGSV